MTSLLFSDYIAQARQARKHATPEEKALGKWAVETYLNEMKRQGIKPYEFKATVKREN